MNPTHVDIYQGTQRYNDEDQCNNHGLYAVRLYGGGGEAPSGSSGTFHGKFDDGAVVDAFGHHSVCAEQLGAHRAGGAGAFPSFPFAVPSLSVIPDLIGTRYRR